MNFTLKKVKRENWDILLEWRNNIETQKMSIVTRPVSKSEHFKYQAKIESNKDIEQYMFIHNNLYVGTIKSEYSNKKHTTLSYTINPEFRGKGYGKLMMHLFLFKRKGVFLCKVKETNFASIRMCEWNGFELKSKRDSILLYEKNIK